MKTAIIGGGISGLSLAHYLACHNLDFVLFEKEKRFGGNAHTCTTIHNGREKYVDMAVNDFNPNTYTRLMDLLEKTGTPIGRVNANTSFFSPDTYLYKESDLLETTLGAEIQRFRLEFMEVLQHTRYRNHNVQTYMEEKGYSDAFLHQYFYPRVQGLFFYPPEGLSALPVQFVANFYALQGGFRYKEQPLSTRCNFYGGAESWIQKLVQCLPAGKIVAGALPVVIKTETGYRVRSGHVDVNVDNIVFACHADDVCANYSHLLGIAQKTTLSRVRYADMVAVAHCDASYLPVPHNELSAYNCRVKTPGNPCNTYTITYNCNKHQNLSTDSAYGDPEDLFFVTVNPVREIAPELILKDGEGRPIVRSFRRNICDFGLQKAQEDLLRLQGQNGLYFTGGYTNGIGLHENCLRQSGEIADGLLVQNRRRVPAAPERRRARQTRPEVPYPALSSAF